MKHFWRLLPLSFILLLSGCGAENMSALNPQGPVAEMQFSLIALSLYIMIFVLFVVFAIYIFVLIKFRERPGDTHIPKQVHGNRTLEIVWTTIPIILLLMLAVPNVMDTFTLANTEIEQEEAEIEEENGEENGDDVPGSVSDQEAITIEVNAHQFWWEFEYKDYEFTAGQDMYIPTDTQVNIELISDDVQHSFWVPALAGKQDNVPGITNEMWLEAPEEGVYNGKCAELCGASHWLMEFKVVAVDQGTFDDWVDGMTEPPEESIEPTNEVAADGREVFEDSCISCHAVGDEGGQQGPDLTNYGERQVLAGYLDHEDEKLEAWLRDTEEYKPDNEMPSFSEDEIDDEEMDALIEYMNSLKVLEED
ncbi:cytochrome c oxidase subunit II [Salisediminibacterium halotolerans]|uniref:Cytochrome c oxidase subunit 2 n=1 Tax=Salisediminibacterium halotolerans TaxID=517425 RepID=A0A1H9PRZ6_9BACI|nr:cytochrome c oxidase subunit II [Salisediminibacterium haloalkalitolerans]SER50962.1 cytochrome c oxidase subunit 2 [Salisediminibacterium haloalkalitolerans]